MSSEADPEDVERALRNEESKFEWVTPHANQLRINTEHTLIENDDAPDELAIYPRDGGDEIKTVWISATGEDSFVSLEEMR